jgi:hypothetical protein
MGDERDETRGTTTATEMESAPVGAAKGRTGRTWARVVGVVALVLVVAVVAFDLVTASPRLCSSCHEMRPRVASWRQSAHVGVTCWECHQTPRPWYAYPLTLADRTRILARDVRAHSSWDTTAAVDGPVAGVPPVGDEVCLQCHEPNRKATSGFRIKINHVEHAKRNGSCVSCHVRTAHPLESRGTPLTLMSQCFTCHGTPEKPEASAACILCHPAGYELEPQSHKAQAWLPERHGPTARSDRSQCEMCHEQKFCDDCHGLEMPHPDEWAQGESGHASVAESNRTVCARCHTEKPDLCSMCHHKAYDPRRGTWVQQHYIEVQTGGAAYCLECHAPSYCVNCHVSWATTGELPQ